MPGPVARIIVVGWLLAAPAAGAAGPRLTVGPVKGDAKTVLPTQLAGLLCGTYECVLWKEVSTRQQPDLAKARRLEVAGILTGAVAGAPGARQLNLSLLTTSARPATTWTFPLTADGRLPESATRQLERELGALLRPGAPAAAPPPARSPEPAAGALAAAPPAAPPPRAAPPPSAAPPPPAAPSAAAPAPAAAPATAPRWLVAAELGVFAAQRRLSYGGVSGGSGTLLGFDAAGLAGPSVSLEVYPFARGASAALGGAGLHVGLAASVGLETQAPTGEALPTSFTRLELGARWRAPPLTGLELVLVPGVAWVTQQLEVSPAIPGLPNSDLSGLRVGLGAEARLGGRVTILAELAWVTWLTARELIEGQPAFFPGTSAAALEAELGAGLAVWGPLSVRVLGVYASTRYTLATDPTGTYSASSAEDRYLGVRAVLRGEL